MARLKSEDKRNAILKAAAEIFAEKRLSASTAAISSAAGIAEGTLFTYFKTKDELVNALYREIKLDVADAMMSHFPRRTSVRNRLQHIWNRYVEWGTASRIEHKVLKQIEVWGGLTEESKAAGSAPFSEIQAIVDDALAQQILQDLPQRVIAAMMNALADTTMGLIQQDSENAERYRTAGFKMLWLGITKKQ